MLQSKHPSAEREGGRRRKKHETSQAGSEEPGLTGLLYLFDLFSARFTPCLGVTGDTRPATNCLSLIITEVC